MSQVSQNRRRFLDPEGDFDLDLSYICDRLIAMSLPCVEGDSASIWRLTRANARNIAMIPSLSTPFLSTSHNAAPVAPSVSEPQPYPSLFRRCVLPQRHPRRSQVLCQLPLRLVLRGQLLRGTGRERQRKLRPDCSLLASQEVPDARPQYLFATHARALLRARDYVPQ